MQSTHANQNIADRSNQRSHSKTTARRTSNNPGCATESQSPSETQSKTKGETETQTRRKRRVQSSIDKNVDHRNTQANCFNHERINTPKIIKLPRRSLAKGNDAWQEWKRGWPADKPAQTKIITAQRNKTPTRQYINNHNTQTPQNPSNYNQTREEKARSGNPHHPQLNSTTPSPAQSSMDKSIDHRNIQVNSFNHDA